MKNLLLTLAALLLLLSFTACAQQSGAPSSHTAPSVSSEPEGQEGASPPRLEDMALEEVYKTYVAPLSVLINTDWASPQDIPDYMYYGWHLAYINNRVPFEERLEKYSQGENNGWFYPAEEYEANIQKYFDISVDYLRESDIYYPQGNYYHTEGEGFPMFSKIENPENISLKGDILKIRLSCAVYNDFSDAIQKELTVKTTGDGFKYISLLPIR